MWRDHFHLAEDHAALICHPVQLQHSDGLTERHRITPDLDRHYVVLRRMVTEQVAPGIVERVIRRAAVLETDSHKARHVPIRGRHRFHVEIHRVSHPRRGVSLLPGNSAARHLELTRAKATTATAKARTATPATASKATDANSLEVATFPAATLTFPIVSDACFRNLSMAETLSTSGNGWDKFTTLSASVWPCEGLRGC
jgi:hypothetical protein